MNHPEFSSGRQQDAAEFLQYYLEQLSRAERTALGGRLEAGGPFAGLFEFAVEERLQESAGSGRGKYTRTSQNMLGLPVKLEDADNLPEIMAHKAAVEESGEKDAKKPKTEGDAEAPKPLVSLKSCLARFAAPEEGISFRGSTATKTSRLATMPRYLLVSLQRYFLDEKWRPSKLECKVPMPDTLSLEELRGKGLQPGEVELPADEDGGGGSPAGPQHDETVVAACMSMGTPESSAKRAALATQSAGCRGGRPLALRARGEAKATAAARRRTRSRRRCCRRGASRRRARPAAPRPCGGGAEWGASRLPSCAGGPGGAARPRSGAEA